MNKKIYFVNITYSEYLMLLQAKEAEDKVQMRAILIRCTKAFGGDFENIPGEESEVRLYNHPENSTYMILDYIG